MTPAGIRFHTASAELRRWRPAEVDPMLPVKVVRFEVSKPELDLRDTPPLRNLVASPS
jgi:hypothetical protein